MRKCRSNFTFAPERAAATSRANRWKLVRRRAESRPRENLRGDVDTFLAESGIKRGEIGSWIIHTGGPKVLQAVEDSLELAPDALKLSSLEPLWSVQVFHLNRKGSSG